MSAILSCGDLNGDSYSDLLLTDAHRYTALLGDSAGSYTEVGTTVAQTDYLAAVEIDFDGDGTNEYLTVGAIGVWTVDMNDPEADPIQYGIFDNEISAAVFGDYDGDGALEIAVLESETNRAALYDFAGGQYQRVQLISPLSDIEKGIVINAVGTRIAVGKFTATDHDQILIQYTWETEAGDSIVVYDPVQRQTVQRIDLHDSETVEALAVGKLYTLAGRDDLAVVVSKGSILYALSWENISGVLTRQVGVKLGAGAEYQINDLAIGDLNSDKFGDLVFLNSNADNSGIGWLTKNGTTGFSISGLGWGETISVDGTFSGLLLADITGDGVLDVVTTQQSTDTDGTNRSFLYISEGNSRGKSLFGPLVYSPLAGEYAAGIDFDGGGADAPFLTYRRNEETGLGDVILAKGRSLVLVQSKEGGTGEEGFYYLVRSASSELPEETAVYPDLSDAYTWVDEWSSFYIEVWGTANGSILYQFKTELAFNSACWTVESVESGTAFTASVSVDEGSFYLTGYSTSSIAPREGEYVLLARVLMAPTETGGVAIPDDGVFQAYNAGFSVIEGSESINGAYFCSESYRDALEDLDLFSVRFDVNDDGAVNIKDFTVFAGDYGRGTESAPYKNPKSATFDVVSTGNGLNIQDFTVFAKSYGMTAAGITERFYDRIGIDPNSWLAASAELADELEDELFEEVSESAPEYVLPLLPQEDEEEEWFLTLF